MLSVGLLVVILVDVDVDVAAILFICYFSTFVFCFLSSSAEYRAGGVVVSTPLSVPSPALDILIADIKHVCLYGMFDSELRVCNC